jgi:hypothetical protein
MAVTSEADNSPVPGTVFTPRQVKALKIAVIVMGVLLVGGFALVLGAIVYQASRLGQDAPAARNPAASDQGAAQVTVPQGAKVTAMDLDGGRLALHLNGSNGPEVIVIDVGSGRVLARIKLKPE